MRNDQQPITWMLDGMIRRLQEVQEALDSAKEMITHTQDAVFCRSRGLTNGKPSDLTVCISRNFLRAVVKAKLAGSRLLPKVLLNLRYGYDPAAAQSDGGKDGIFNINRDYRPKNDMIKKLYDRFLDTRSGTKELREHSFDPDRVQGVRVVSHGMGLLGFVQRSPEDERGFKLLLVDVEINRH